MADPQLRERFKQGLLSQGITWDDNQIDNYLTLREAGSKMATDMQNQAIAQRDSNMNDSLTGLDYYGQNQRAIIPQEEKNAMWDFTGNLLWEAMDSATFGSLGWADWSDPIEEALTGDGPQGFAGRVGAGLGGFAGFLVPMAGTGAAIGKGVQSLAGGTKAVSKQLVREGKEYLGSKAGQSGLGYKKFREMSSSQQEGLFKPFVDDILEYGPKIGNKEVKAAYINRFTNNLSREIEYILKSNKIRPTKENIASMKDIIQRASGTSRNSSLPIASLEQKISLALGNTFGSGKAATMAATALAEGITFAAVETPFELFQSMEEGREANYTGRAAHAFALGNALGLIKYIPGGKQWREGSIWREAKKWRQMVKKKRPYSSYDLNSKDSRDELTVFLKNIYRQTGSKMFHDKVKGHKFTLGKNKKEFRINHADDITTLMESGQGEGAAQLVKVLESIERDFTKSWLPTFLKEAAEDITGSMPRMLAGSMAFNYEMVFDENIPLEDKVFHSLLGAWMTKKGRVMEYTNVSGGKEQHYIADYQVPSEKFSRIKEYLDMINLDPAEYNFTAFSNHEKISQKFPRSIRDTDDIKQLEKILERAVVDDTGTEPPKPKSNGKEGSHPIYEYLRIVYDAQIGSKKGTRALSPEYLDKKTIKKIEKELKDFDFDSIIESGGIKTQNDVDTIFYEASDKVYQKLIQTHIDAAIDIYNHLSKGQNIIKSKDVNTLTELYDIVSLPASGKKIGQGEYDMLAKYRRIIDVFDGRYIRVNQDASKRLNVEAIDFKGLGEIIQRHEKVIDTIVYGENKPVISRAGELMQEGFLYEMMIGQDFHKGVREIHAKLTDTNNTNGKWKVPEQTSEKQDAHDGITYNKLKNLLLYDRAGDLYSQIEFGSGISESQQRMVRVLHKLLSVDPNGDAKVFNTELTGNVKTMTKDEHGLALDNLREILYRNGMKGFLYQDALKSQTFLARYQSHALSTFLKTSLKSDGTPLNAYDRSVISQLLDFKLLGPNFKLIDVIGVIEHLGSLGFEGSFRDLNIKNGKLYGTDGKPFDLDTQNYAKPSQVVGLKSSLKELQDRKIITPDQIEELILTYKKIIEPMLTNPNDASKGFIKPSSAMTQIDAVQLEQMVGKLTAIAQVNSRTFNDNLLRELSNATSGVSGIGDNVKEKLNWLHHLFSSGRASTSQVVAAMAERKLYNIKDQKVTLDPADLTLNQKISEIIKDVEWDIKTKSDAVTLENRINNLKTFTSKNSEVDLHSTVSKQSLITEYNLPKDVEFKANDVSTIVNTGYILKGGEKHYFRKTEGSIVRDKVMDPAEQMKFISDISKAINTAEGSRTLRRLSGVDGMGIWTESDYQVYDNHMFRFLESVVGNDGFAVIDLDFGNKKGGVDNARIDLQARKKLEDLLYDTTVSLDPKYRKNKTTQELMYEKRGAGSIIVDIPGVKWSIAIGAENLNKLTLKIREALDNYKNTYTDKKFLPIFKELELEFKKISDKEVKRTVDKNNKVIEEDVYTWKPSSPKMEGETLSTLLTVMQNDKWMKGYWWDHLAENVNGKNDQAAVKLARRIKMFANTSMRTLDKNQLENTLSLYENYITNKSELKSDPAYNGMKALQKNGGMRIMVAGDENFSKGTSQFSLLQKYREQINTEKKLNKGESANMYTIKRDPKTNELSYENGGDISTVDGYMVVSPEVFNGLLGMNGHSYWQGSGAIKPMIHRVGEGVILGKTAFIVDPNFSKFFKRNQVDGILMESATKIKNKNLNIFTEFTDMNDLKTKKIDDGFKELLALEDISLGFTVKPNHDATLPYQVSNHLNVKESRDLFDYYLKDRLNEFTKETERLFNVSSPLDALADAKLMGEGTSGAMSQTNSLYARWINSNGFVHSQVVMPDYIRQVKSKKIDKGGIMSMKTPYGGQAVNSPAIKTDSSDGKRLRFTTFTNSENSNTKKSEIYTYGEAILPDNARLKDIDRSNMHVIKHFVNAKDQLLTINEVDPKGLIKDGMTLGEAKNILQGIGKNLQIATVFRRNPSTRPGDMVIVGLKEFLSEAHGNQVKLNAYDYSMRLEGDYDVDKTDFFWAAPKSVMQKWNKLAGEVLRVNTDSYESGKLTSLTTMNNGTVERFNWLKNNTVKHWDMELVKSEKLRGTTIKTQRILAALENYSSFTNKSLATKDGSEQIKGFSINLENTPNGGIIYIDPKKLRESKKVLATDIQNITDSLTGYNSKRYNQNWESNFLFGGAEDIGLFSKAIYNRKTKLYETVGDYKPDLMDKAIITEAIKPYKGLLQLGTSLFTNGKSEKVKYEDFISGIQTFDTKMSDLYSNIYWTLKKRGKSKYKINTADLEAYFKDPNGKILQNVLGEFGSKIRPGMFSNQDKKDISAQFTDMLPFERSMSIIAYNDKMKLEMPGYLKGKALQNFHDFYAKYMYNENFNEVSKAFIAELNNNDKMFSHTNFLAYRIAKQKEALQNAYGRRQNSLIEIIEDDLVQLKNQKDAIEKEMILGDIEIQPGGQREFAKKIRDGAVSYEINQLYKNGKLPSDWESVLSKAIKNFDPKKGGYRTFQNGTKAGQLEISNFVNQNYGYFQKYIQKKGVIRFKGVHEPTQMDLLVFHNMFSKFENVGIRDVVTGTDLSKDLDKDIFEFEKFYREQWKNQLSGKDWTANSTRTATVIEDRLQQLYEKWDKKDFGGAEGGFGNLFLWKLMTPKVEKNAFTYTNSRLTPAFKDNSLSMIRLGLKFISNSKEINFTEMDKNNVFDHITNFYNTSFRGMYGHRNRESGNFILNEMGHEANMKTDIFKGAPLIDDIRAYRPGLQETMLNENLAMLFGDNRSLVDVFSNSIIDPSFSRKAASLSQWAFNPVSYIPENTNIMNYPQINGYKNFKDALNRDAMIMIGNKAKLDLLYNRNPKVKEQSFEDIQPTQDMGYESFAQETKAKVFC